MQEELKDQAEIKILGRSFKLTPEESQMKKCLLFVTEGIIQSEEDDSGSTNSSTTNLINALTLSVGASSDISQVLTYSTHDKELT